MSYAIVGFGEIGQALAHASGTPMATPGGGFHCIRRHRIRAIRESIRQLRDAL